MMQQTKGKEEFVAFLRSKGYSVDECHRIFSDVSEFTKNVLKNNDNLYIRGVLKLEAKLRKPRVFKDNLNNKTIYAGERYEYSMKNLTQ